MQTTNNVFMVRPGGFCLNHETASSNAFQHADASLPPERLQQQATLAFDRYVSALRAAGIAVLVFDERHGNNTPDSLFPNNWVTLQHDGSLTLFPMEAPNRRRERDPAIVAALMRHFRLQPAVDLSGWEQQGEYLEGTGALVCDHQQRIAYVCRSSRSSGRVLREWQQKSGYQVIDFTAEDAQGRAIYHTNVMMSVGIRYAVVCLEAIVEATARDQLLKSLNASGKTVIAITMAQMHAFCGNVLELCSHDGHPVIAMSEQAWRAFTPAQQKMLSAYARIVQAPIAVIEQHGGGGARCMLAEIFAPKVTG
ncbi:citrulline utilization hydrolase CtlX [Gibbsiella quercinecans]|uniref:citrulline utilization hydrolase CtlX n=1 Tax=Gibbsiella quercinecans TaxID=929813 RepID=UPI003A4DCF3D